MNVRLNIGDIVKYSEAREDEWEVLSVQSDSVMSFRCIKSGPSYPKGETWTSSKTHNYYVVKKSKSMATNNSLINKFKLSLKSEPEKSFIEKGIMDIEERFTAEGKELFDLYLYQQNKAGFKTSIVDKIPDEKENA